MNVSDTSPTSFLQLPKIVGIFPSLRRCTLLFAFARSYTEGGNDVEWMTAAFALSGRVSDDMQELMTSIGMPRKVRLEEAMGPGWSWADHRNSMAKFITPALQQRVKLLQAKKGEGNDGGI